MSLDDIQSKIGDFVSRTFLIEFGDTYTADTDLFDTGVIDSYGFVDLVGFLEQTWDIAFTDDDMASDDMASINGLTKMVAARRAEGGA